MPTRNSVKQYVEDGVYHIYNRGVEKRNIFKDDRDYKYFLYLLKIYLSKPSDAEKRPDFLEGQAFELQEKPNFYEEIELLAYCLMPNHFHLLIKQKNIDSMSRLMKCLATNYSIYFNRRYNRVGSLFQGIYKAVLVTEDSNLLHLSRYIHLNPDELSEKRLNLSKDSIFKWTSYDDYLGLRKTEWVKPELVLRLFNDSLEHKESGIKSYKKFVEEYLGNPKEILGKLTLEDDKKVQP